ncbi:flavin reductase family protein [Actinomadura oligospora]|uniref:flavin reductase family protein n=1 Tax=Actinomadura oligospora TaxID=111804 RepID=UPI0004B0D44A|nr:flavin reductase family protein [Actinomadura oligospora]
MSIEPPCPEAHALGTAPDPRLFRRVVGRFATGVAVVTTVADGVDHAMTVNAFTSVSLDPLLVMFCADRTARFHDTVLAAGTWAVSVLPDGLRAASEHLATRGRPIAGQLDGYRVHRGAATGAPVLSDALAAVECRTHAVHEGGDHSIVVGEVLSLDLPDPDAEPLIFHDGRYRRIAR